MEEKIFTHILGALISMIIVLTIHSLTDLQVMELFTSESYNRIDIEGIVTSKDEINGFYILETEGDEKIIYRLPKNDRDKKMAADKWENLYVGQQISLQIYDKYVVEKK